MFSSVQGAANLTPSLELAAVLGGSRPIVHCCIPLYHWLEGGRECCPSVPFARAGTAQSLVGTAQSLAGTAHSVAGLKTVQPGQCESILTGPYSRILTRSRH